MSRLFCLQCHGFTDPSDISDDLLKKLASTLPSKDARNVLMATPLKPTFLFRDGQSIEFCQEKDQQLIELGVMCTVCIIENMNPPRIFTEQRGTKSDKPKEQAARKTDLND